MIKLWFNDLSFNKICRSVFSLRVDCVDFGLFSCIQKNIKENKEIDPLLTMDEESSSREKLNLKFRLMNSEF